MEAYASEIEAFLLSTGLIGLVINNLLIVIEALIPMLPMWLFCGINIIVVGPILAYLFTWAFTVLGGVCMFWICRKYLKKFLDRKLKEKSVFNKAKKLSKKIDNMSIPLLSVLIACPFTPSFVINMGSGLSDMKFRKFLVSMIIGKSCMIFYVCYVGTNAMEALHNPTMLLWMVILLLIAYIVSMIVNNYAEKRMSKKITKKKTKRRTTKRR